MKKFLAAFAVILNLTMGTVQAQGFNEWVAVGDESEDPFADSKELQFANIKDSYFSGLFLSCREGQGCIGGKNRFLF